MTRAPAIEVAGLSICGRLASLHRASFGLDAWDEDAFARLLEGPCTAALIARDDGAQAAGACGFVLVRATLDEAEILTLSVLPERRREGIASRLVGEAARLVATSGARVVFLEVAVDNTAARELYRAAGFNQVGVRRGYYERRGRAPCDALLLRLDLDP